MKNFINFIKSLFGLDKKEDNTTQNEETMQKKGNDKYNINQKGEKMNRANELWDKCVHLEEEPKEFNFGTMVGYAMMMLSVAWDCTSSNDMGHIWLNLK